MAGTRQGGRAQGVPVLIPGQEPPARGADPELDAVTDAIHRLDPDGSRVATVLRDTFDQLYDGQHTGRYHWEQLRKTEKTYMGTIVEINLHREFEFADGATMDYEIEGVEVDCKYSQSLGGWEFPPEAYEHDHLCLVVWADEELKRWEAGIVRVDGGAEGLLGSPNRDRKRKLTVAGQSRIRWLYAVPSDVRPALPENLLLHLDDDTRRRIFDARPARGGKPGQARTNMLFRLVQQRIVNRATVLTVAQQDDSMKRPRDARLPRHLGREGILVLGHQEHDPDVARALRLPVPQKGEFISARVFPAEEDFTGPAAEITGMRWRLARTDDPVVAAPQMPRVSRRGE
jgi:hypothetical protein